MRKQHWSIDAQNDNSSDGNAFPDLLSTAAGAGIPNFQNQGYFSHGIGLSPIIGSPAYYAEAGNAAPIVAPAAGASSVLVTNGGMTFDLQFDAASSANTTAAAAFRAGIEQAASMLSAVITNKITVNIAITWSGTGGGAAAGPASGYYENYSAIRSDLISNESSGDTIFNGLPTGSSIQGQSSIAVWNAQLKLLTPTEQAALGLNVGANDLTTADGSATFATDIASNALIGVALHELTHALGRVPYGTAPDIFDLFRFTAAGAYLFSENIPSPAAYFSLDGGQTNLANYGLNSDPSDFLNSGAQAKDPFAEYYTPGTTLQTLTPLDLEQLEVLGFNIAPSAPPPPTTYSVSAFLGLTPPISPAVSISDSSNAVAGTLNSLQSEVSYIANISLTDTNSIFISPTQSVTDNAVLSKITDTYSLTVTGTSGSETLEDTANSVSSLIGGTGTDTFIVSGKATITNFGGADILDVSSGGVANAKVTAAWTASSSTSNSGTVNITTNGLAVNLSAARGPDGYTVADTSTSGHVTLTGSGYADTLTAANGDTLTGGGGIDTFVVSSADTVAIADLGNGGADILDVSSGGVANAKVTAAWTASSSTSNSGTVNITTNGLAVNLSAAGGPDGYTVTNVSGVGTTLTGSAYNDTLTGGSGNDIIIGNGGYDTITGGLGADTLTGGSGHVTFVYNSVSDSKPSSHDTITDFSAGRDIINFTNIAGINASGGVATFQGQLTGSGNLTLKAHNVGYIEVSGNTEVLVNTTSTAEIVTSSNVAAANMEIVLTGIHLGLTSADFHHV